MSPQRKRFRYLLIYIVVFMAGSIAVAQWAFYSGLGLTLSMAIVGVINVIIGARAIVTCLNIGDDRG